MARQNNLGTDSVPGLVLKLAIPSMIAQFVNVLYGIVDRIYIGNIAQVGDIALAGAGVCGPIVTLISSFASLVGLGAAPLLAIRLGEKNKKSAEDILANSFIMLFILSLILTFVFLLLKRPMLLWFGASADTLPYAETYLTIYTSGSIFAILSLGLNYFIICQGFSSIGMMTVLIGAVLNIIFDPIFIFVFDMGIAGAGYATILSQFVSCMFVLKFLSGKKTHVRIKFEGYSSRIMKRIVFFGASPFIILATDSILIIALNAVLQHYGGPQNGDMLITCSTIVQSFMQLITMPMAGITGGTQSILSYNYGAKNINRIRQGFRYILLFCLVFTAFMFTISRIVPQHFVGIFTRNPEYIQLSIWGIQVFTLAIIPLSFQYTFVDGLTALGIAPIALGLSLFRKTTYFLATLLLPMFFGATNAFYAEPISGVLSCIVSTTVFTLTFNKLMSKRVSMPDNQPLYS